MQPIKLLSKQGFPFRFGLQAGCTPYLQHLESDLLKGSVSYHRSTVSLKLVREDVLAFRNSSKNISSDSFYQTVVRKVADDFKLSVPIHPIHLNDVFDKQLPIWKASPGLPYTRMGFKTKDDVRRDPHMRNNIRLFWHKVKTGHHMTLPDCCAFVRSHLAPPGEEKVRAVWGYPMAVTMAEAMFALPLIQAYRDEEKPIAYGFETALGGTRKVIRTFSSEKNIYALDFKSFDKTVPAWLVRSAFWVLEQNIDFLRYQDHGVPNVVGILRLWDVLKSYFIKTPIRLANGERYKKASGVASGSYFTQLIGSIINAIIINYVALRKTNTWPIKYKVFGDDSLFNLVKSIGLKEISELIGQVFGMFINYQKSSMSDYITDLNFLGYGLEGGLPRKEHSAWIYALLYPEHPDLSWDQCASRALGLYYANLGVDGRFHELCTRVITHRGFDLVMSRSMEKMLRIVGFGNDYRDRNLPTQFELLDRYVYK